MLTTSLFIDWLLLFLLFHLFHTHFFHLSDSIPTILHSSIPFLYYIGSINPISHISTFHVTVSKRNPAYTGKSPCHAPYRLMTEPSRRNTPCRRHTNIVGCSASDTRSTIPLREGWQPSLVASCIVSVVGCMYPTQLVCRPCPLNRCLALIRARLMPTRRFRLPLQFLSSVRSVVRLR